MLLCVGFRVVWAHWPIGPSVYRQFFPTSCLWGVISPVEGWPKRKEKKRAMRDMMHTGMKIENKGSLGKKPLEMKEKNKK